MRIIPYFTFILLSILILSLCERTSAQSWMWAKGFGVEGFDESYSIAVDQLNGAVYTTGVTTGYVDWNIFISKLDSLGNLMWSAVMAGAEGFGLAIALGPSGNGDTYTTGYFEQTVDFDPGVGTHYLTSLGSDDIFISKLDSSGNLIWAKSIGGINGDRGYSISVDSRNGDIYSTGHFRGKVDFDPGIDTFILISEGSSDIFITKFNDAGEFKWAKAFGGENGASSYSIINDNRSGNVFTTGHFDGIVDFDPGPEVFNLTSLIGQYNFISKLDEEGNFVWAKAMGGDYGASISVDPVEGDIYSTGAFTGTDDFNPDTGTYYITSTGESDMFITKLDSFGNFEWVKSMGGVGIDVITSLVLDTAGNSNIYFTGAFSDTVDFDPGDDIFNLTAVGPFDIFISKLDNSGSFGWAKSAGGTGGEVGYSIAFDPFKNLLVTGSFGSSSITFDSTILNNAGGNYPFAVDIFISKLGGCTGIVTTTGNNGFGSLRDIISCATSGSTITFDLAPLSEIILSSGEIIVNKNLTLSGPGMDNLSISGNNTSRIFNLLPGNNLGIENLTMKNASSINHGGAIYTKGNLTLENVLLQNNFENGIPKCLTLISPGRLTIEGNVQIKQ